MSVDVRLERSKAEFIRLFAPSADLRPFVDSIYIVDSPWHGIDQYIPAWTKAYLVLQYADPVYSTINGEAERVVDISLSGMVTKRYRFTTPARHIRLCIVEFTPVGMYCLLRENAAQFTDVSVDANMVFPSRRRAQLCEALYETADDARKIGLVEDFLRRMVPESIPRNAELVSAAVAAMKNSGHSARICAVANALDVGERHFRRVFGEVTGLSPKSYQRVERFRDVFHSIGSLGGFGSCDERSFYDQSHLIRDFRSFTGFAPGSLPTDQFFFYKGLTAPGFGGSQAR